MLRDSDRIKHPDLNIKYVDHDKDLGTPNIVHRIFSVVAFYIAYHAKRHISGKYMGQATNIFKMMINGGRLCATHNDFRCIIACALFYDDHIQDFAKDYDKAHSVHQHEEFNDDISKTRQFAEFILDGEFQETLPNDKMNEFKDMRKNHAPIEQLLKL